MTNRFKCLNLKKFILYYLWKSIVSISHNDTKQCLTIMTKRYTTLKILITAEHSPSSKMPYASPQAFHWPWSTTIAASERWKATKSATSIQYWLRLGKNMLISCLRRPIWNKQAAKMLGNYMRKLLDGQEKWNRDKFCQTTCSYI